MRTVQLNIGLSNNPLAPDTVIELLSKLDTNILRTYGMARLRLMAYYIKDKTFNGEVEPTVCAMLEILDNAKQSGVIITIEKLCELMTQESIAVSTDTMELLVFNPEYRGEGYLFDKNLFEYIKL